MRITGTLKLAFLVPAIAALLVIASLTVAIHPSASPAHAQDSTPDAPTGLRVSSSTHDSVTLTWVDPNDGSITSYQILRRSRDGDEYEDGQGAPEFVAVTDNTGSTATTHTDTGLDPRTRYVYRVKARNAAGLSPWSSYANAETEEAPDEDPPEDPTPAPTPAPAATPPPVPDAPTGLAATSVSYFSLVLNWNDPGNDSITGYQILRRNKDQEGIFATIESNTGSSTTYTDSSAKPGKRYAYRVKAINAYGAGAESGYVNVDTPGVPDAPAGLTTTSVSYYSVTLSWNDPGNGSITGYQVLRRYRDGDEYGDGQGADEFVAVVDDTGSSATTYTDASVAPRTRYVYRVRARNPQGLSESSGDANAETLDAGPPLAPGRGSRPNVVIILADDLGWGDVQSNNPDSAMTTPRIDSIATAGAKFTDAHSPSSNCTGTRYGLLTGRYSWRSWLSQGVLNGYDRPLIGPDRPTLGTLLQDHGYRTAAIGKWHLGMDFARLSDVDQVTEVNRGIDFAAEIVDGPTDHGFDEFFGTTSNLIWTPHVYIRDRRLVANPDRDARSASGFYEFDEV